MWWNGAAGPRRLRCFASDHQMKPRENYVQNTELTDRQKLEDSRIQG